VVEAQGDEVVGGGGFGCDGLFDVSIDLGTGGFALGGLEALLEIVLVDVEGDSDGAEGGDIVQDLLVMGGEVIDEGSLFGSGLLGVGAGLGEVAVTITE